MRKLFVLSFQASHRKKSEGIRSICVVQGDCVFILPCGELFGNISHLKGTMMKTKLTRANVAAIVAIAMFTVVLCTGSAQAIEIDWPDPNWPEIFEPNQLRTLNLEMDPCDWQAILHSHPGEGGPAPDCIYDPCELPAWFWMEGEEDLKIVVEVRRKKGFAFPDENDPCKVGLKIDINQYYGNDPGDDPNAATEWHDLKKLSLEVNIDSIDVISEGVACNLHQMASGPEGGIGFYANWVKLYVNGNYIGIYPSAEQRDKQFMKHRDMYTHSFTWLYKYADCEPGFVRRVVDDEFPKSPAVEALCYAPFINVAPGSGGDPCLYPSGGECSVPDDANVAIDMNQWVDMKRLLTSQAVAAFLANSDSLFESGNNTYFLDFNDGSGRKRLYIIWDVDSSFKSVDRGIYYTSSSKTYEEVILQNPVFRSQYNQIMRDLLDGPFQFDDINDFLDTVEPVISSAVEADPWAMAHILSRTGATTAAEQFDWLRDWFAQRIPDVRNQVDWDEPIPPPGIILLQDSFEGAVWDANWTNPGPWLEDNTGTYAHGSASATATNNNEGTFTCVDLDASDAIAIHIDFWFRKKGIESPTDFTLSYYKGSYVNVCDLETLGGDSEWLHYTDTITDSNYFVSNFKIQFNADLGGGEDVWVDDVVITKEVPPVISGHILDPNNKPIDGVLVDANNAGGSDTTDIDGYYEVEVPKNWSGTVTPTKEDYTFEPNSITYVNVTADQTGQDYVGTSIYDFNEDGFIDFADLAVCIPAWLSSQGDGNWNPECDFYYDLTVNFKDFAKFGGAWKPE